jgi:GNAT superfamily N-acetyltransferase
MTRTDIRAMVKEDLDFAVDITHQEGWGYSKEDLQRILEWSPEGCFVLRHEGRRSGMATTLFYGGFGWVGNVVVSKDLRGRGFGLSIMKKVISHLTSRGARGVRLFAYENTVSFYEKMGFVHEGPVRVLRRAPGQAPGPVLKDGYTISPVSEEALKEILDMDRQAFGGDRGHILKSIWRKDAPLMSVLRKEGRPVAFLAGKKVLGNIEVGPWVCTLSDIRPAISLMDSLLSMSNCHIYTALSESQGLVLKALNERGFKPIDKVFAMAIGHPPPMMMERLLSVGALEKG